ncbi:MAG: hypothetical protein IAE77_11830 [Prosthecobacter sp.]|jgi:hypothetical protein|uniref:hypothetical protein n=1 Tax=Prosthecobacter sp. TaxID=1965333 RepID=UPI0019FF1CC7|nr:hypothetical protein [Prosthecobacter sp.]MBE2284137.1 hypothetical protein [Prosthecobacter sp.]
MFCCHSLKNLIDNAGQRGLAVLVCPTEAGFRFALQMRAVTAADETTMTKNRQPSASLPEKMTLSESMRIRHCPSCGKRLDELAASDPKFFAKLASEHRPFQNQWGV